jgi:hypothetical protein
MQTNLKAFEDKPDRPLVPPGGDPPPDNKSGLWLLPATAATIGLGACDTGLGEVIFEEPHDEEEKEPEDYPPNPPYVPTPGTGETNYPEVAGSPPPPEVETAVANWGVSNFNIENDKTLSVFLVESDKNSPAGLKIDLSEYYRLCAEAGFTPSSITLKFEGLSPEYFSGLTAKQLAGLTVEELKNFTISLLDSTSAEEAKPSDAHTYHIRLKDQTSLQRSNTIFDTSALTVTLDLTKRNIESLSIMTDKGEESDPADASYISNIRITAADSFSFDLAARPAGKKDWAFAGIYHADKFDLPASTTFSYSLSDFAPPYYPDYSEQGTGYRIVFSFGQKEDGNYRELVYDPTGFTDGRTTDVPAGRIQESYLALHDAEAEALGHNDLRLKFYGKGSSVTVSDIDEQEYTFNLNDDDRKDTTKWSRLVFKVKKYNGFSKEDFLSKINLGLVLSDGKHPFSIHSEYGEMDYVLVTDSGDSYELSVPLLFLNDISMGQRTLKGVFFSSVAGSNEFEIADIKVSAVGQGERRLTLPRTDRTGFTGFGVALDNKDAQTGINFGGCKVGSQDLKASSVDLDSEVRAFTLASYTGYYPDDDEEQPFVDTGRKDFTVKVLENQGVFFYREIAKE